MNLPPAIYITCPWETRAKNLQNAKILNIQNTLTTKKELVHLYGHAFNFGLENLYKGIVKFIFNYCKSEKKKGVGGNKYFALLFMRAVYWPYCFINKSQKYIKSQGQIFVFNEHTVHV
jgi:hypothetical protein